MKRVGVFLYCIIIGYSCSAQLYGAQWLIGDVNEEIFNFKGDTLKSDTAPGNMPIFLTCADICDWNGNFLYYTNGIYIFGNQGELLQNGDTLSPCTYTNQMFGDGLGIIQATLFLPKPGHSGFYYLFHFSNDTLENGRPGTLYYSLIDSAGNFGLGAVVQKNIPILKNVILRGGGMTACKHANGRDYWLIMGASVINRFYKFLITPDSIIGPFIQDIGPEFHLPYDNAYSKFSQDGSKFATGTFQSLILVMDFDRCSGDFANPITIYNNSSDDSTESISGCAGLEFSPNNRFLYVAAAITINQYDLLSANYQDSILLYQFAPTDYSGIDMLQFAPNGKIYGSTNEGGYPFIHQINYPDNFGDSCGFIYAGQPSISLNNFYLPNLINYALGPLIGSGCDTIPTDITSVNPATQLLKILPNPADKYVYVEMGMQGNYEFDLLNETGQLLNKRQTPQVDYFDTENLAGGIYFISVIDKITGVEIANKKLLVMH